MSDSGDAWWIAASSFTLPLAVLPVLWYKGLMMHYHLQVLMVLLASFFSFMHHICYESALQQCVGQVPAAAQAFDILFAFLVLVLFVSPFIECWMPRNGRWWATHYNVCMGVMAALMVFFFNDGLAPYITLGIIAGGVFLTMAYIELRRRLTPEGVSVTWWLRYVCVFIASIPLIIAFAFSTAGPVSYSENRRWHGWTHSTASLTLFFALTLLPDWSDPRSPVCQSYSALSQTHESPQPVSLSKIGVSPTHTKGRFHGVAR